MEKKSDRVVATGITRFDEILGGGFPRHSLILFLSDVGSEADILALQILWNQMKEGNLGVIYDFDLPPMDLREKMKDYGWDVKKYEKEGRFILADMFTHTFNVAKFYPKEKYFCKRPNDLTYIANFVHEFRENVMQQIEPGNYFSLIYSIGSIFNFSEEQEALKFIYSSRRKYRPFATALYLLDPRIVSDKSIAILQNLAEIVVKFSVEKIGKSVERFLRVIKAPLYGYLNEPISYSITHTGIVLSQE